MREAAELVERRRRQRINVLCVVLAVATALALVAPVGLVLYESVWLAVD